MRHHIILSFFLTSSLIAWQGCSPKAEDKKETASEVEVKAEAKFVKRSSEEAAAKRAQLSKTRAEKETQRKQALAEKLKSTPTYRDAKGNVVYYKAEVDPSYTGGFDALTKYLEDNIHYPEAARERGDEGTVFVEFVVDSKGHVGEVFATDVVGEDADFAFKQEAVRVVAAMPLWTPGRQHGKPVATTFSVPITFELKD
jgi:TonB family protein